MEYEATGRAGEARVGEGDSGRRARSRADGCAHALSSLPAACWLRGAQSHAILVKPRNSQVAKACLHHRAARRRARGGSGDHRAWGLRWVAGREAVRAGVQAHPTEPRQASCD